MSQPHLPRCGENGIWVWDHEVQLPLAVLWGSNVNFSSSKEPPCFPIFGATNLRCCSSQQHHSPYSSKEHHLDALHRPRLSVLGIPYRYHWSLVHVQTRNCAFQECSWLVYVQAKTGVQIIRKVEQAENRNESIRCQSFRLGNFDLQLCGQQQTSSGDNKTPYLGREETDIQAVVSPASSVSVPVVRHGVFDGPCKSPGAVP
ncbi:hypothetical protein B0H65DRAFT_159543 [Neurospora tetraspora]|uniref:Uncharacterized protein n=1 Tax=Neurospora tetraspora TaxID=94610 RepID=A0AAE0JHG6_9PEZI|nr:hypothetical protein B0H65DRAFT_159543 [Neurospora tetraspora]